MLLNKREQNEFSDSLFLVVCNNCLKVTKATLLGDAMPKGWRNGLLGLQLELVDTSTKATFEAETHFCSTACEGAFHTRFNTKLATYGHI